MLRFHAEKCINFNKHSEGNGSIQEKGCQRVMEFEAWLWTSVTVMRSIDQVSSLMTQRSHVVVGVQELFGLFKFLQKCGTILRLFKEEIVMVELYMVTESVKSILIGLFHLFASKYSCLFFVQRELNDIDLFTLLNPL